MDTQKPTIEYRDIPGFPGYRLGSDGSVWSSVQHPLRRHKPAPPWHQIALQRDPQGYLRVNLYNVETKYQINRRLHILLLEIFVGPRPAGMYALHRNDRKDDNRFDNLYWGTRADNVRDAHANGRYYIGLTHHACKLSDDDVRDIRRRVAAGESHRAVANLYHISRGYVGDIVYGKERTYVK